MNKYYLEKADINTPKLYEYEVTTDTVVDIIPDETAFWGVKAANPRPNHAVFTTGDRFILDFGQHCVGYLSFRLRHDCVYLDAPVRLVVTLGYAKEGDILRKKVRKDLDELASFIE